MNINIYIYIFIYVNTNTIYFISYMRDSIFCKKG